MEVLDITLFVGAWDSFNNCAAPFKFHMVRDIYYSSTHFLCSMECVAKSFIYLYAIPERAEHCKISKVSIFAKSFGIFFFDY